MRPIRKQATSNGQTYMIRSSTWGRRALFPRDTWPNLLIDTPLHYAERLVCYTNLGPNMEVWQKGFSDHRIRDAGDYRILQIYIRQNPVRKQLGERAEEYPYSSARPGFDLAPAPRGLKPLSFEGRDMPRPEGAPFEGKPSSGRLEAAGFQSKRPSTRQESSPSEAKTETA